MRPCTYICCFFGGRDLVDGWMVFWLLTCVCWVPFEDTFLNSFPWCDSPGRGHWSFSPLSPPPPFVSCPFCRRGFFCVCCILMVNLPLGICKRWSCLEEKIHYDPWATSRLEDCRNLCCCVSMHVAVKLVWEQRKPVCGSRVKWAVFWWASVFERS